MASQPQASSCREPRAHKPSAPPRRNHPTTAAIDRSAPELPRTHEAAAAFSTVASFLPERPLSNPISRAQSSVEPCSPSSIVAPSNRHWRRQFLMTGVVNSS
ncbi:hypothetical protein M0R45_026180 [Rubus argutus]|uniref:Uncharacterized protein n=1 Tax=Rubus argutus TaxID=59490 RepID=A0AAW1X0D1_RUBAR